MRPVSLAVPSVESREVGTTRFEKDRVLQGALDEVYFRTTLTAGNCAYDAGVVEAANGQALCMQFPAGATNHVRRIEVSRDLWPRTRPRLNLWFTSDAGSTNTFTVRFTVRHFGAVTGNASLVFSLDFNPAGPAVAGDVKLATVVGSAVMPSLRAPVHFRVGRITGDANANKLDVLAAEVVLEEVA